MKKVKKSINEKDEAKSPCIQRCSLDQDKICPGCYRSIEEIVLWPDANNPMRRKILKAVKLRRARIKK